MNERIRELAGKAGFQAHRDGHIYTSKLEHLPITDTIEKFAELIVQECADVCERFGESGDGYTCSAEILEHFRVEE